MNDQTITVNLIPGLSTPAVVRVSQYDVGRPLMFRILDGTESAYSISYATSITVVGTKPSGLGFSVSGTVVNYSVSVTTTEEMTQEAGMIPAEIRFANNSENIGTANFILAVEPSPHPEGTTDGTQATMADLETRLQGEIDALDTRVDALEAGSGGSGLTDDVKTALLQIAQKVAYIDANGQDYYDDLYDALYSSTTRSVLLVLSHVSSSNSQSTVEVGDSYTTTLTASTNYTINSVTVAMGGVDVTSTTYSSGTVSIPSVTGNIVITATAVLAAQSITATYTQGGTVYDTDSLDSLKADLVVTANYAGGTSETVPSSAYTLSGTLAEGTSTITVSYAGLTDTFSVNVTHYSEPGTDWTSGVPYDMTTGAMANYYLNNGVETAYNGWSISPYMECHGAFVISDTTFSLNYNGLYDESNTYINKKAVTASQYYNFDEYDAASLRVSEATSKVTNAVITPYRFDAMTESTVFDTTKHYTPSEWTDGAYINVANGSIVNNSAYKYSGYMNCYNASNITDTVKNQSRGYCFYDGNKDFISGVEIASSDATLGKQTTVPNNARYFRVWKATPEIGIGFTLS